jgi:hypothetical protein
VSRCTRCGRASSDCVCGWPSRPQWLAVAVSLAGALLAVRDVVGDGGEPGAWALWLLFVGWVIWEVAT